MKVREKKGTIRVASPKVKKPKQKFVAIRQVLTANQAANECYGEFSSIGSAEHWINGRDRPQEYFVLPLTILPKEEQ
jgi:hypothetical protein